MLDYRVPDLPMPIRQTSNMVCWAFVATMMASWRDRTSHTVDGYIGSLGEPWMSKLAANSGLRAAEASQLFATMGLQIETTQANFTAERWENMLRDWGPLWVNGDKDQAPGYQGTHAYILVGIHGPSDGDPTMDAIDPAIGREVQMPMSEFVAHYEQLANRAFAGLQILHWPVRAQQAAQQSLVWAQQAAARHARTKSAEAAVAAVGLLYQVFKEAITSPTGLSWKHSELRGKTVPGNSEAKKALADQGTYQAKRLKSLRRLTWDEFAWNDNVGAEFEISYEYNGTCVANVHLTNTSYAPPAPLSGRNLSVDTDISQAFAYERGDVAAVQVEIVYQFTYARGSAGTFTQRYVLFGDGRQELFTETRS
jgi:papain like cysteine protease AvrRpt2